MRIFTTEHIERARSGRADIYTLDDLNAAYQAGHHDGRNHTWWAGYEYAKRIARDHAAGDHKHCDGDDCDAWRGPIVEGDPPDAYRNGS
jgi:hypothetical protein